MFSFKLEPDLRLLTVVREGAWSIDVVRTYETALRLELTKLHRAGRPNSFIIDIRSSGLQRPEVAEALRTMVESLGPVQTDRTAVVTSSGLAKLETKRMGNPNARVFTSMVLARDWVIDRSKAILTPLAHDEPSDVAVQGVVVHVHGPADVNFALTPDAALETAKRIADAAEEVLIGIAASVPQTTSPKRSTA